MENLIEKYANLCIQQDIFTQTGDYKNNNKTVKNLVKIQEQLKELNLVSELFQLLNHENLNVQLWSASDLIENNLYKKESLKLLKKIATNDKGIVGLGAEMTLKRLNEW
jgi:Domain of unknown function (DUF2019)